LYGEQKNYAEHSNFLMLSNYRNEKSFFALRVVMKLFCSCTYGPSGNAVTFMPVIYSFD